MEKQACGRFSDISCVYAAKKRGFWRLRHGLSGHRAPSPLRRLREPFQHAHCRVPVYAGIRDALPIDQRLAGREVLAALRALPARQREAVVLRHYLGLTEEQAAAAMNVARGTIKSATSRGLSTLARILKEEAE